MDLCSKLGMDLKREMLVTLAKKSCYPDDPAKQQEILSKYKDYIIPVSPCPSFSLLCWGTLASEIHIGCPLSSQIMYCSLSRTKYQDHACSLEKEHVCLTLSVSVLHVSCQYVPLYLWTCPTSSLDLFHCITELIPSSSQNLSRLISKHFPPHH